MASGTPAPPTAASPGRAMPVLLVATCVGASALLFALAFGDHGYAPTDQGFILGQSWRIHGGQVPYRDFLYVRPPGSLYLHTLWFALPDAWVFRASRYAYYGQLAIAALVPAWFALRVGLVGSPVRLAALCVFFYVVGLHNFPPMPWYTVDGVFFGSLGLVAALASERAGSLGACVGWRALASLLLGFACLAKQNFLALPALLIALDGVAWLRSVPSAGRRATRRRAFALLASALPATLLWACVGGLLARAGAFEPFLAQTVGASSVAGLGRVGFAVWAEWPIAAAFAGGFAVHRLSLARPEGAVAVGASLAPSLALALAVWGFGAETGRWLFAALAGVALAGAMAAAPKLALLLGVGSLAIAWSASISFGAETPLLGLVTAGAAAEVLLSLSPARAKLRWLPPLAHALFVAAAVLAVVRIFALNADEPYRTVPRSEQTRAFHEIFPRFGRLYGGEVLGDRMLDLRKQVETHALAHERDFTVIPGFPLVHFLVDRQTRAPMDWYVVFDLFHLRKEAVARLLAFDGVILLERAPSPLPCNGAEFANVYRGLSSRVFQGSRLLASSRYFCILEPR